MIGGGLIFPEIGPEYKYDHIAVCHFFDGIS